MTAINDSDIVVLRWAVSKFRAYWVLKSHSAKKQILCTGNGFESHGPGDLLQTFRREILRKLSIQENRFGFEPEITAKVSRLKVRIYEVPMSCHGRTYAEGKKIGWRDGFRALECILKYNFFDR